MTKIYACLAGDWVCLNDEPTCTISEQHKTPFAWWEENAPIFSPLKRKNELEDTFYGLDYITIYYQNRKYRISPIFVQIVEE